MWIVTPIGFFSVVQKEGDDLLSVRSRVYADLVNLKKSYAPEIEKIETWPTADYKYRVFLSHDVWARVVSDISRDINYPNFKRKIKQCQGYPRAKVYGGVWGHLFKLEQICDDKSVKNIE